MSSFDEKLDLSKTALLLIEFQNEFTSEGGKLYPAVKPCMDNNNMLPNTIDFVKICREKGLILSSLSSLPSLSSSSLSSSSLSLSISLSSLSLSLSLSS
jgi:hypothetical protein